MLSGTDVGYAAIPIMLRVNYALSGTDVGQLQVASRADILNFYNTPREKNGGLKPALVNCGNPFKVLQNTHANPAVKSTRKTRQKSTRKNR